MRRSRLSRRAFLIGAGGVGLSATALVVQNKLGWLYVRDALTLQYFKPEIRLGSYEALDQAEPFDACIIGSGPAGTVVAMDLVKAGYRVLLLESGPVRYEQAGAGTPDAGQENQEPSSLNYSLQAALLRGLGGTSQMWSGRCSRLYPLDFARNAYTPAGAAWPFTYEEFAPYYERAELTLRVSGGRLSAYHPPNDGSFPLPPYLDISALKSDLQKTSITVDDSPTSTGKNFRLSGPVRVAEDLLPDLTQSADFTLVNNALVTRLLSTPEGTVTGAEVKSRNGETKIAKARTYVIASGGAESARLLLLSHSDHSPHGLGNDHDLVGRNFMEHPNILFSASIPDMKTPGWEIGRSHQFYEEFKHKGLGSIILVFSRSDERPQILRIAATLEMEPTPDNRITLSQQVVDQFGDPIAQLSLRFSERDQQTMAEARRLIQKIYADLGAVEVQERDLTWSHHLLGVCRMGDDPATSVLDRNLRVHSTSNLYVVGSAAFVTGGAAHPTPAIVGLAHRLADHLISSVNHPRPAGI